MSSAAKKGYQKVVKVREVKTIQEFKAFIMKGNVLDLAVGIIIGLAFATVINSMVNDVIMPPVGMATGGVDFKEQYVVLKDAKGYDHNYTSLDQAQKVGAVTWRYGAFINAVINFIIVAFCIFMIVKLVAKARRKEEAKKESALTEKDCPFCLMRVPINATKCGHCTSQVEEPPSTPA